MTGFSKEKRQKQGSVYTPPEIIQWIHDKLIEQSPLDLNKTYWDPACGTGRFPIDWYNRLIEHWNDNQDKYPELDSIEKAHRHIVEKCLYFSDIDPFAIRLCRFALYLKCPQVTNVKFNSYCGDSLLGDLFSGIEKFDYVVGNPPYISFMRSKNNDNEYKKKLDNKFKSFSRKGDIYYLFIEQAINKSKDLVGMVTQDTFSRGEYSENLRKIIKQNGAIIGNDVYKFKNAEVYTRMFCFKQNGKVETLLKDDNIIIKLMEQKKILKDYTITRQGINTGNDKLFIVAKDMSEEKGFEKKVMYPVIKGANIKSYITINISKMAIVCNDIEVSEFPNVKGYIESNKELAESSYHWKKGKVKRIYDITQHKSWPVQKKNLVICSLYTVSGNDFTLCDKGMMGVSGSSYALPGLQKEWLGILNSNVAAYFYLKTSKRRTAKLLQRSGTVITSLPIPNNIELFKVLDPLVDKMLTDPNDKVTEKEINRIVYELYDLSDDEIKTIEESTK